jgi:hypothetical protein
VIGCKVVARRASGAQVGHFDAYVKGFEAASVPARDWLAQHLAP